MTLSHCRYGSVVLCVSPFSLHFQRAFGGSSIHLICEVICAFSFCGSIHQLCAVIGEFFQVTEVSV
jgi:hypothetical protein